MPNTRKSKLANETIHRIAEEIGAGQFGRIYKGRWQSGQIITEVAIKVPSETYDAENEIKLLQEAAIMGQFQHPNVLTLYGMVTQGNPVSSNMPSRYHKR